MKKGLQLLFIMSLTPLWFNTVSACAKDKTKNDITERKIINIAQLLTIVTQNINNFVNAELIAKHKNILFTNNFSAYQGKKLLTAISNHPNSVITEQQLKDPFVAVVKDNIKFFGEKLATDDNLKSLFYGINTSDILQLNVNDTILTKNKFDEWKNNDAFYHGYKKETYKLDQLNSLTFALSFTLNYKNNDNIVANYTFNQKYNLYFANDNANVVGLIEVASEKPTKALDNYLLKLDIITDFNGQEFNLFNYGNNKTLLMKMQTKIINQIANKKVSINEALLPYALGNTFSQFGAESHYWTRIHQYRQKTPREAEIDFIKQSQKFKSRFTSELDNWSHVKLVKNKSDKAKTILFGQLQISEWQYNGLNLKLINVPFIITGKENITERFHKTARQVGQLFAGNTIFGAGLVIDENKASLTMKMNTNDFITYKNKTFGDSITYIQNKTFIKAQAANVLTSKDYYQWINRGRNAGFNAIRLKNHLSADKQNFSLTNINEPWRNCAIDININGFIFHLNWFHNWTINNDNFW